jgi:cellulose synthase/poly-beta-1,6-N-acetylglucosamine synthase-like glycosyltransferase
MTATTQLLAAATLGSIVVVAYVYLGYPILVWFCSRLFGRPPVRPSVPDTDLPMLTLMIAAYNEERDIGERVRNALQTNYPASRLRVVVASDGSTDATNAIVAGFRTPRVKLFAFPVRRGKAAVINDVLGQIREGVVMLSDANTTTDPNSARHLAAWFADPSVGAVCGRLVLTDPQVGRNVDSLYWKYETFLKKCESRLGALLGSNGGIYAIRRSVFTPIPTDTLVDDFVLPLLARSNTGCRIVYDRDAVACEETPASMISEFHRRARIGAGGFQSIGILWRLLLPQHGWVAFTFLSHKVLRWVCPFFLLAALGLNILLLDEPLFRALFAAQLTFYALSLCGGSIPARPRALRILRLPAMFTMMNAALFVGFWRWALGRQKITWRRTQREVGDRVLVSEQPPYPNRVTTLGASDQVTFDATAHDATRMDSVPTAPALLSHSEGR